MGMDDFIIKRKKIDQIKCEIPKDYSIDYKKIEIQYQIYTQSTCFVFGDKGVLNKYIEDDDQYRKEKDVDYYSDEIDLFKEFLDNPAEHKPINPNVFSMASKGSKISPIYLTMMDINRDRRIKHLFIPTVWFTIFPEFPEVFFHTNKSKKKIQFKKLIEEYIDPKKNEWKFLRKLEIPSGGLVIDNHNYIQGKDFHTEWTKIFPTVPKKEFKIYAVISNKSDLIKMYNSQDPKVKISSDRVFEPYENITFKPSGLLDKEKTFHGIMLY